MILCLTLHKTNTDFNSLHVDITFCVHANMPSEGFFWANSWNGTRNYKGEVSETCSVRNEWFAWYFGTHIQESSGWIPIGTSFDLETSCCTVFLEVHTTFRLSYRLRADDCNNYAITSRIVKGHLRMKVKRFTLASRDATTTYICLWLFCLYVTPSLCICWQVRIWRDLRMVKYILLIEIAHMIQCSFWWQRTLTVN